MERITRFRALAMLLAFALVLGLFGGRIYSVQMKGGSADESAKLRLSSTSYRGLMITLPCYNFVTIF